MNHCNNNSKHFPLISEAIKYLSSPACHTEYNKSESFICRIRFKENIVLDDTIKNFRFSNCFPGYKNVLISFLTKNDDKYETQIVWRSSQHAKFYLVDIEPEEDDSLATYCLDHIWKENVDISSGKIIFSSYLVLLTVKTIYNIYFLGQLGFETKSGVALMSIEKLVDKNKKRNLLIFAVLSKQLDIVDKLLKCNFDVDYEDKDKNNPIDYAWKEFENLRNDESKDNLISIIMSLLNANSKFPSCFSDPSNFSDVPDIIKKFEENCRRMRKFVDNEDIVELENELKKSNLRYYYDRNNVSLMAYATRMKKQKFVMTLLNHNILMGYHENIDEMYNYFDRKNREILKVELIQDSEIRSLPDDLVKIFKNSELDSKNHIFSLLTKSRDGNKNCHERGKWLSILTAFSILETISDSPNNKLKTNPSIILKIVATFKDLKIHFDFKHDSTYHLHPITSETTGGIVSQKGEVIIGAKNLTDANKQYEVIGTLIHELCHLAVELTYLNNFLPYPIEESTIKDRFHKIFLDILEQSDLGLITELIIKRVFDNYKKTIIQIYELIVRPLQMDIHYIDKKVEQERNQVDFSELYSYQTEVVESDCDTSIGRWEKLQTQDQGLKYKNLTDSMKAKVLHSRIKFLGINSSLFELIGEDFEILNLLSPECIKKILMDEMEINISNKTFASDSDCIIDRKFRKRRMSKGEFTFEDIANQVKVTHIFILVEVSGAGKTTTFLSLARKLKHENKSYWVSLVNLKDNEELIKKLIDKYKPNKNDANLENFFKEIQNISLQDPSDGLEIFWKAIFQQLYSEKKVIFMFDGLDGVCNKVRKFIVNIILILKKRCQVWVNTRPHIALVLEKLLKTGGFKFVPFTLEERQKYMNAISKMDTRNDIYNLILPFVNELEKKGDTQLYNNLLIKTLFVICRENKNNFKFDDYRYYQIFSKILKKYGLYDTQNEDMIKEIEICYVHALKKFWLEEKSGTMVIIDQLSLVKTWKNNPTCSRLADKIKSFGILTVSVDHCENQENNLIFVDELFVNFFIFDFFQTYLFNGDSYESDDFSYVVYLLETVANSYNKFETIHKIMLDYINSNKNYLKLNNTVAEIINGKILTLRKNIVESSNNYINKLELWSAILSKDETSNNLLHKLWGIDDQQKLLNQILDTKTINSIDFCKILNILKSSFGNERSNTFSRNVVNNNPASCRSFESEFEYLISRFKYSQFCLDKILNIFVDQPKLSAFLVRFGVLNHISLSIFNKCPNPCCNYLSQNSKTLVQFLKWYFHSDLDTDELIGFGENIEHILGENQSSIRKILFSYKNKNFTKILLSENLKLFNIFRSLYVKHQESPIIFINYFENNSNLLDIFLCTPIKNQYNVKEFVKDTFAPDPSRILNCINSNNIKKNKELLEDRERFKMFEELLKESFPPKNMNEEENICIKICIRKILVFKNNVDHPIFEAIKSGNLETFNHVTDIYNRYKSSQSELQDIFVKKHNLPQIFLIMPQNICESFQHFMNDIFDSEKMNIFNCIGTDINNSQKLCMSETKFSFLEKFVDCVHDCSLLNRTNTIYEIFKLAAKCKRKMSDVETKIYKTNLNKHSKKFVDLPKQQYIKKKYFKLFLPSLTFTQKIMILSFLIMFILVLVQLFFIY